MPVGVNRLRREYHQKPVNHARTRDRVISAWSVRAYAKGAENPPEARSCQKGRGHEEAQIRLIQIQVCSDQQGTAECWQTHLAMPSGRLNPELSHTPRR